MTQIQKRSIRHAIELLEKCETKGFHEPISLNEIGDRKKLDAHNIKLCEDRKIKEEAIQWLAALLGENRE